MDCTLEVAEFLEKSRKIPVLDVRSEGEYIQGHWPGSFNIPLFNNLERAEIGTIYKKSGKEKAVLRGLEITGPKLAYFVGESKKIAVNGQLLVHCWRGGMRSGSFAWLLQTAGMKVHTLLGGYKNYRQWVLQLFQKPVALLVLGGETGSGKTEMLNELMKMGEQVIDLEALARHKGSAFGAIGESPQPSSEQFENNLADCWHKLDPNRRVWVEDESHSIGKVFLPDELWKKMKKAPIVRVQVSKEKRIGRLLEDYGSSDPALLEECILKIQKRLGGQATKEALNSLKAGDLTKVAEISLDYYDKAYFFNHQKRNFENIFCLSLNETDARQQAICILNYIKEKKLGEKYY